MDLTQEAKRVLELFKSESVVGWCAEELRRLGPDLLPKFAKEYLETRELLKQVHEYFKARNLGNPGNELGKKVKEALR